MYVFGRNVAKELLNNNKRIKKVYIQDNFSDKDIVELLEQKNIPVEKKDRKKMDLLESGNHQGIIMEIDDYNYIEESEMLDNLPDNPFIVVLDHLEDPHNFGAIIRTCESAGVNYIVIPKDRCVKVTSTVMKVSCGALDNVKIVMVTNLNNFINKLKKHGVWIVGTALENSVPYTKIDYRTPTALIIGNEGSGMSDLVTKNCDFIATIPMNGKINSLNASVATGIMIYEVVRQRGE